MLNFLTRVSEAEAKNLSPVTLAFVGDAVYSLYVRENFALEADCPPKVLQKLTCEKVSAHGQNVTLKEIAPLFTEEEAAIFKRGRNAKKSTRSKSASVEEYNNSTGFEAVLGYLYLTGNYQRINMLLGGGERT